MGLMPLHFKTGSYVNMKGHSISKERLSVNVSKLGSRGTYFLQVLDSNKNVVNFKYIVLQ